MTKPLPILLLLFACFNLNAQPCTPQGDQNTYGTNNRWIGYVYDDINRTVYRGYVNEGTTTNPDFDEGFGGATVNYATNGCPVSTTTFSVRFKLQKSFTSGNYSFTVGADDGYRLSVDGGATWIINSYNDQSYASTSVTVFLNGTVSLVLDYYENSGDNRVTFSIGSTCSGSENPAVYGTGNIWYGYVYDGTAFNTYSGRVTEGSAATPNFDESFGGSTVNYPTSGCPVQTETYSVRYRLQKTFTNKTVSFTVGADDGYRFSIDGGSTWLINQWNTQSYASSLATVILNGSYNLVLEYYENTGENRVTFSAVENIILPLSLVSFTGSRSGDGIRLNWMALTGNEELKAEPQRSNDGISFISLATIDGPAANIDTWNASYTDVSGITGRTYYRLKLTGADQQVTYSSVISFTPNGPSVTGCQLYPTIVAKEGQVTLVNGARMPGTRFYIHDVSGRLVGQSSMGNLEPGQISSLSLQRFGLRGGLHFVTIADANGTVSVQKLILK
ncbi:MAG: hypothetical protein ABWZ25_09460 [Chitinophagaceae bacterium]